MISDYFQNVQEVWYCARDVRWFLNDHKVVYHALLNWPPACNLSFSEVLKTVAELWCFWIALLRQRLRCCRRNCCNFSFGCCVV